MAGRTLPRTHGHAHARAPHARDGRTAQAGRGPAERSQKRRDKKVSPNKRVWFSVTWADQERANRLRRPIAPKGESRDNAQGSASVRARMKQGIRDTIPTHERDVESGGGFAPLQHDSGNPHAFGPPLGVTSVPRVVKAERTEQHSGALDVRYSRAAGRRNRPVGSLACNPHLSWLRAQPAPLAPAPCLAASPSRSGRSAHMQRRVLAQWSPSRATSGTVGSSPRG